MRIVLVEFLPSGGMFQFSFQFADALAKAGHQVQLLTGPDPELASQTAGFEILPILSTWHPNAQLGGSRVRRKLRRGVRALRLATAWRQVVAHLRQTHPDIAQFGELRYGLDSAAFVAASRFCKPTKLVDVAHNPLPYDVNSKSQSVEKSGRLTSSLLRRAYEAADLMLVLGEGPKADLVGHFPEVRRVVVCGHGDYSSVLPSDDTRPPSSAPPHALFFGAWTKYKNIPLLLEAFARVRDQLPDARLTIAGPVMPDVDLPAIETWASAIGNVDLMPGYVAMEDVPDLFARHRVVMFTYETVNISGSVHMAYTFGRPVVATRVGSMTDVVADGVTGLLAEQSAAAIAKAMLVVLRSPGRADEMGAAAAAHARNGSTWAGVADKALAGYQDALAPSLTG